MVESAAVVSAEVAVIGDGHAVGDVCVAAKHHRAPIPRGSPGAEAPSEAGVYADGHAGIKRNSTRPHNTHWRRHNYKARIGNEQPCPNFPGVVIRNVDNGRIDRHDLDETGFDHHALLHRRHQHIRLLRLQPHGLDRIHHVARLVVVSVAELGRPGGVLRQFIQFSRELDQTLHCGIPSHAVRTGGALIGLQIHVLVEPCIGGRNLVRIGRTGQNERDQ